MEKKMIPISHDDYVKGKWKSVSSSSGEHEAKIWLNDDGSIDAEASYSDSYCRKHQLGRYAPKADSSSSTSSSSSSHSSKAEKSHNKELAKMENEKELKETHKEILSEIKHELRSIKSHSHLPIDEKALQLESLYERLDNIYGDTKDDSVEALCENLEEQLENALASLPIPASAEEQLACLSIFCSKYANEELHDKTRSWTKKVAKKAREQYPENEELQSMVNKFVAPKGSSFIKKMWIEYRIITIAIAAALFLMLFLAIVVAFK
jgi:hypothetical protein